MQNSQAPKVVSTVRSSFSLALLLAGLFCTSCVKEISSEERLERETQEMPAKQAATAAELAKINCDDAPVAVTKARSDSRPENERVTAYSDLFALLRKRIATFEEAMSRNPDLAYQEGSHALVSAKESCIQQLADIRVEFERYVRELVNVPTVQEIKGGNTVTVARIDFVILREAIEVLAPEDKEQLLQRVSVAEKKVEVKAEPRKKK